MNICKPSVETTNGVADLMIKSLTIRDDYFALHRNILDNAAFLDPFGFWRMTLDMTEANMNIAFGPSKKNCGKGC